MQSCSVTKRLKIVRGSLDDYRVLSHFHYRDSSLVSYAGIFAMRLGKETVGVIVYSMPSIGLELRNHATGNLFAGLDRRTRLALVNRSIRCISRVIIEPRFRGLGLASRLVRETMPEMRVPIVEAMAVMGMVNPFFERAGMTAYRAPMPARCVQVIEALSRVGIEEELLIDAVEVQKRIDRLQQEETAFINNQIRVFLQSYGKRRHMPAGLERTRYVLSKLTDRPVYYIWFNTELRVNAWMSE
jgi:GNAT superfamily N-acetyltransferase